MMIEAVRQKNTLAASPLANDPKTLLLSSSYNYNFTVGAHLNNSSPPMEMGFVCGFGPKVSGGELYLRGLHVLLDWKARGGHFWEVWHHLD